MKFAQNFMSRTFFSCWLLLLMTLVIAMISLGGYVRITGSGLSITKWEPIIGVVPPLSEEKWGNEFDLYKQTPEFEQINFDFSLQEFKKIYWMEYLHRALARFLGIVAIFPLLFCWKKLSKSQKSFTFLTVFLIGLQGLMGWIMVASGLQSNPHVSHFKLAAHFLLAFLLLGILTMKFSNQFAWKEVYIFNKKKRKIFLNFLLSFIFVLLIVQIFFGALTAGLHAGKIFNTSPLMENQIIPDFLQFENWQFLIHLGTVQFFHRFFGIILGFLIFSYFIINLSFFGRKKYILYSLLLLIITSMQIWLGILTLLHCVPENLALLHQFVVIILFLSAIFAIFNQKRVKVL